MFKNLKFKIQKLPANGFSLVEFIVVVAIMGILGSMMLANYRGGSRSIASRQSAQSIAQAVRLVQNRALAGSCSSLPCSFGAHFNTASTSVSIFEDGLVALNGQYDTGESLEAIELEANIFILTLSSNYTCGAAQCADVLFTPPDPAVSFMPMGAGPLTISVTGGSSVVVGEGGSIDIN